VVAAICAACRGAATPPDSGSVLERHQSLWAAAWGPESPEKLQKFLDVRRAVVPLYRESGETVQNWALQEASSLPALGQGALSVMHLLRTMKEEGEKVGLTQDDLDRLTMLVYARWLRAVSAEPPPERRTVRMLREMEVGIERHLANNPPPVERSRAALQRRLERVKRQAELLTPIAAMDKRAVLERIDPATRRWCEQHRAEIEELTFGYLDTTPPSLQNVTPAEASKS